MTLETATTINQLVPANPDGLAGVSQGDDHIRLIKSTLQNTFPNITAAVTATHTVLNTLAANVANYILRDGSVAMTGALNMGGQRITSLANGTAPTDAATVGQVNSAVGALTSDAGVIGAAWPVGSIFIAGVSTNPGTLLGVGTWTAIGQGRVLVGAGTGNDGNSNRTFANGSTGGSYDVALSQAQLPAHNHGIFAAETGGPQDGLTNRNQTIQLGSSTGNDFSYIPVQADIDPASSSFFGSSQSTGSGQRHENTQPFLTVHMWRRTA